MTGLAATIVAIAVELIPDDRAEWAAAMEAEFEAAGDAGRPVGFAFGCLWGSIRLRLDDPTGRMDTVRAALAIATLVPLAAFHLGCSIAGFRFALGGTDHFHATLASGDAARRGIADAYAASAPLIGSLLLALAASHLAAAWHLTDWHRAALRRSMISGLGAAIGLAAAIVSVMGDLTGVAIQFAGFGIELALVAGFSCWSRGIAASRTALRSKGNGR